MKANAFASTLIAGPLFLALLTACGEQPSEPAETTSSHSANAFRTTGSTTTAGTTTPGVPTTTAGSDSAAPATTAPLASDAAAPATTAPLASDAAAPATTMAEASGGALGDEISNFMGTEKGVQIAPADASRFAAITCEGLSQGKSGTDILNAAESSFPAWNSGDLESLIDASVGFGCPQYESEL